MESFYTLAKAAYYYTCTSISKLILSSVYVMYFSNLFVYTNV